MPLKGRTMRHILIIAGFSALISFVPRIARAGCDYDSQCKGDRVCEAGVCVAPPAASAQPQATCGADTDCAGDAICEQGVCHSPGPSTAVPPASSGAAEGSPASMGETPPTSTAESAPPPTNTAGEAPGLPPGPPVMEKQFDLTGFLSPAGQTMFVGFQADVSMTSKGVARSPMLGASLGIGWRDMPMGDEDETVSSFHLSAWLGYQTKVSSAVTYRVKAGGLVIKDSLDQFGGGGFLAGETKFGAFLCGLDLWLTASADIVVRMGLEL